MYSPPNHNNLPQPADIIKGAIIAKAVIQLDGKVHIIAVFNTSTEFFFFFHFEAKTSRTPRKNWKYLHHYHQLYGDAMTTRGKTIYYTMLTFANSFMLRLKGSSMKIRNVMSAKNVREFFHHVSNPIRTPWAPAGSTFNVASKITSGQTHKITRSDRAAQRNSYIKITGDKS